MQATKKEKLPTFRYEGWVDVFRTNDYGQRIFSHQVRVASFVVHKGNVDSLRAALESEGVGITEVYSCGSLNFASKSRREV